MQTNTVHHYIMQGQSTGVIHSMNAWPTNSSEFNTAVQEVNNGDGIEAEKQRLFHSSDLDSPPVFVRGF